MAEVRALDDYYLAITLLITIAYQLFFFAIAFSLKFDKLTGDSLLVLDCLNLDEHVLIVQPRLRGRNQFCCARNYNVCFPRRSLEPVRNSAEKSL